MKSTITVRVFIAPYIVAVNPFICTYPDRPYSSSSGFS